MYTRHMHTNNMSVCMQRRKAEAVQLEDYSAAKDIKAELDCLRARLEDLGVFVCVFGGGRGRWRCVRASVCHFFLLPLFLFLGSCVRARLCPSAWIHM